MTQRMYKAFKSVGHLRLLHSLSLESCFLVDCRWHLAVWEEAGTRVGWLGRGLCMESTWRYFTWGKSTLSLRSLLFSWTCLPSQSARAGIAQRGDPRMWSSSVSWKLDPCWTPAPGAARCRSPHLLSDAGFPVSWAAPWGKGQNNSFSWQNHS